MTLLSEKSLERRYFTVFSGIFDIHHGLNIFTNTNFRTIFLKTTMDWMRIVQDPMVICKLKLPKHLFLVLLDTAGVRLIII